VSEIKKSIALREGRRYNSNSQKLYELYFGVRRFNAAFFLFSFFENRQVKKKEKESGVKAPHSKESLEARMSRYSLLCVVIISMPLVGTVANAQQPRQTDAAAIEFFEKRIRPVLVENCYECHGAGKKRSGLALDNVATILQGGERGPAIVPGNAAKSLLIQAIEQKDKLRMPPKGKLTDRQIADLTAWVKMGAPAPKDAVPVVAAPKSDFDLNERRKHWAYQPVKSAAVPAVKNAAWPKSPIDNFVLAKLEKANLTAGPPADRRALIRRVTFDLIGLPPTPDEVDAFLADQSPSAFAIVVDRLLASPHYGERWGRHWLDLVRYAETLGFEFDYDLYNAWRYRDYVIRAFNADLPYDRFIVEHLAGDLVPQPRRHASDGHNESILATGFFWMGEARQTPIDIRQEQADVIDNQIDVLGKALLGQTVACARCHDHKFDAISTRDYYALAGYLKSSRYQQAFIDSPKRITAKTVELAALRSKIRDFVAAETAPAWLSELEKAGSNLLQAAHRKPAVDDAKSKRWRDALEKLDAEDVNHPLHAWIKLAGARDYAGDRKALQTALEAQTAKSARAAASMQRFEDFRRDTFAGWHVTGDAFGSRPARPGEIIVGEDATRPVVQLAFGGAQSNLLSNHLQGELRSRTFTIEKNFVHVRLAGRAARFNLVVDGNTLIMNPIYGKLTIPLGDKGKDDSVLAWRTIPVDRWVGQRGYFEISDSSIPMHRLNPPPSTALPPDGPQDGYIAVDQIAFSDDANPPSAPNDVNLQVLRESKGEHRPALAAAYQKRMIDEMKRWQAAMGMTDDGIALVNWLLQNGLLDTPTHDGLADLLKKYREIEASIPAPQRAPALADGTGEDERVFLRGSYKSLGESAPRDLPAALRVTEPRRLHDEGSGRLELARRLVDSSNPLFARVMVNRIWLHHFGEGIVRTPDDFGRMGQPPTHPELLDYLATEFVKGGWSIKKMHRLMVLSSTYQMSSQPNLAAEKVDPENR